MNKRFVSVLALLLCFAMLIPSLVACNGDETSSDASEDVSGESSDATVEELVKVENPENKVIVTAGKTYTCTVDASEEYTDSYGIELTDGQMASNDNFSYTDPVFSGYQGSNSIYVTVDLGEDVERLYEFTLGFAASNNSGLVVPDKIRVMLAKDGGRYETIGEMEIPELVENTRQEAKFVSEYYHTARYVRFVVGRPKGWVFLDEVQAFADIEGGSKIEVDFLKEVKDAYDELGAVKFNGGITPDETVSSKLISQGAEYTVSVEADKSFPDKKNLTDGIATKKYQGGKWVGFEGNQKVEIVVDLGKSYNNIYSLKAPCYANPLTDNHFPVAITYSVSDDNEKFVDIGRVFAVTSNQPVYDFPIYLDKCASGRYVKFTLESTPTSRYLIEEVEVYAHDGTNGQGSLYPAVVFDREEKSWETPSNDKVNLIKNLKQQIFIPDHAQNLNPEKQSPHNTRLLTDGRKATGNDIHNGQFFRFTSTASPIDIYFDLTATSTVTSFSAQFTHRTDWGVNAPGAVTIYLSNDAREWYNAGQIKLNLEKDQLVESTLNLSRGIQARYVCFSMLSVQWIGISELEVFGSKSETGATLETSGLKTKEESSVGYFEPNDNILNGAKDLCLLYHGVNKGGYDANKLIPYLAYVDQNGKIQDTMFDSFLFLISGAFPSGLATTVDHTKADIEWAVNDLFANGKNILALEEAAGKVKTELNLGDDFKYQFTVSLYKPNSTRKAYGDLNGDGKADDLTTDANRLLEIQWQMKLFEQTLAKYNFKNIEFAGYYWFNEGVYPNDNEAYLVQQTSRLVHNRGKDFFWIPWFCAPGVPDWKKNGFDVAVMQPGYVFEHKVLPGRLDQAADLIRSYGMGIEIEIAGTSFNDEILYNRYLEYLAKGAKYGYMKNCVHMYYQELNVYFNAANSKDARTRYLYDATYQFIKGTLPAYPDALETITLETEKNKILEGNVMVNIPVGTKLDLVQSPAHGTVTVADDGTFMFFPEKDFTGTVQFAYTFDNGLGASDPCVVEITVK